MASPRDELAQQVAPSGKPPSPPTRSREHLADQAGNLDRRGGKAKLSALQANYVPEGPIPFVCGNCATFDPATQLCSLVQGPGEAGEVAAPASCRLFRPVEARRQSVPKEAATPEEPADVQAPDEE